VPHLAHSLSTLVTSYTPVHYRYNDLAAVNIKPNTVVFIQAITNTMAHSRAVNVVIKCEP